QFPAGDPEKARVAFSNWIRLGQSGESLLRFVERMANRLYYDFEKRAWGNVIDEFKKVFEAGGDALPDPKEFAERLYGGHTWMGPEYKLAAGFEAGYSLTD